MTKGHFGVAIALALIAACGGGRARPEGTCVSAQDCGGGEACVQGACIPLVEGEDCSSDEACGADRWCDQGQCRDREARVLVADAGTIAAPDATTADPPDASGPGGCASDSACRPGEVCEAMTCAPGCAFPGSPISCGGTTQCNPNSGRCEPIPPCTSDVECGPPSEICEAGACVPGCGQAGGITCGAGTSCELSSGRCMNDTPPTPCASDATCGAPTSICESSICVPGCNQTGGMSCGGGAVCNNTTGRCQALSGPCTTDAQCSSPSTVCEAGQCVGGCGQPGGVQCVGSTACNAGTGRCDPVAPPPCASDSACNPPSTVCESGACVSGCATSGCTGGQICGSTTGRCEAPPPPPPSCAIDQHEENDTQAAATVGLAAGATHASLAACDMDDDFYAFDLGVGDRLRVEVLFSHAEGDIDVQVLTPSATVGVRGSSVVSNEDVSYTAVAAGRHAVRVLLYRDAGTTPGNAYSIRLTHTPAPPPPPPPMCTADRFEENDSRAGAHVLALPASDAGLTSCMMDDDFYSITVAPGDEITARVTFNSSEADVDASLLDAGGQIIDDSTGVTGTEQIVWAAVVPSTVAFRVYMYRDTGTTPGVPYDLSVTRRAVCTPDAFEENDTQATQQAIITGFRNGLSACEADDDYYRVTLAANQAITVNLDFAHAEGDIDLYLLDSAGGSLRSSVSVDDDESVTFTPTAAGNYTIRVRLYGELGSRPGNFYTMDAIY